MLYLLQVLIDFLQIRYNSLLFSIILGQKNQIVLPWGGGEISPNTWDLGPQEVFLEQISFISLGMVGERFKEI